MYDLVVQPTHAALRPLYNHKSCGREIVGQETFQRRRSFVVMARSAADVQRLRNDKSLSRQRSFAFGALESLPTAARSMCYVLKAKRVVASSHFRWLRDH